MRSRNHLAFLILLALVTATTGFAGTYTETFTGTAFKDTTNTTANWDTTAGELKLYTLPLLAGSYDTPGVAYGVAVDGYHAYVADDASGLQIIDITDPSAPFLAGTYNTSGFAYDVVVSGNHAFVADHGSGLQIIDITDPTTPALIGTYNTPSQARGVAVAGNYAFVADYLGGLRVVDISNPAVPTLAGTYNTPATAYDIAVAGDHAFLADGTSGLQVIDISDPTNPTAVGAYGTSEPAHSVALHGDYAFVAIRTGGLLTIDIADPTTPTLVGSYNTASIAKDVVVDGDYAFVAVGIGGLVVIDISDPTTLTLASTFDTSGNSYGVAVDGTHAYMADYTSGLQVIQIADIPYATQIGASATAGEALDVVVRGDYAFIAADDSVSVVDISDPTTPIEVGACETLGAAAEIEVDGDYAFVAGFNTTLYVIDVFDPTAPAVVATYDTTGLARGIAVDGNHAFIADATLGLLVIDISDPTAPTQVAVLGSSGTSFGVAIHGDRAYLADLSAVQVIDIANPTAPTTIGAYNLSTGAAAVVPHGDYLFVADFNRGLEILDISSTTPIQAGIHATPGASLGVAISGGYAFVATNDWGLEIFDVSDPATPTFVSLHAPIGNSRGVVVAGDHAFVAEQSGGIQVLRVFQQEVKSSGNIAHSLALDNASDEILAARLSTTQTTGVTWELSINGGADWDSYTPGQNWVFQFPTGTDILWRSTHTWTPGVNPSVSDLTVEWLNEFGPITAISDVPEDQGGRIYIELLRSGYDGFGGDATQYGIYRRVDSATLVAQVTSNNGDRDAINHPQVASLPGVETKWVSGTRYVFGSAAGGTFPPGTWALVQTVPALQTDTYLTEVTTAADSSASGSGYNTFVVTTHTTTPTTWFISHVDSGYSVDNLAPGVPMGMVAAYNTGSGNQLSWDPNTEPDLQYYRVYRDTDPGFVPSVDSYVEGTASTNWTDPSNDGGAVYYKITAVDHADNESAPASPGVATAVPTPVVPTKFALDQNIPNPFNPTTTIRYDVASGGGKVTLQIFDVSGRLVTTLIDRNVSEGQRSVVWDGSNNVGNPVATGTYFYRLTAPGFQQTRKMVLLK